jgi:HTH-type transcriptional regulator / antitoxin HigA
MNIHIEEIAKIWPGIQNIFAVPHSEKEYNRLVNILDDLIDEVGENESHPLASLMETLGSLVETYEAQNIPQIEGSPSEALRTLMAEHDLKQSDLLEIGSQGVISELLSGKRHFNVRQIKLLSKRFKVSPAVFM